MEMLGTFPSPISPGELSWSGACDPVDPLGLHLREKASVSLVLLGPSFLAAKVQVSLKALLNSHLIRSFLHLSFKLAFDTLRHELHYTGRVAL